jgi:hypothetical protein
MGKLARVNAQKKFCAKDIIPMYEEYYKQVLAAGTAAVGA